MRSSIKRRVLRLEGRVPTSRDTEQMRASNREFLRACGDALRRYCQRDERCPRVGYCDKCIGTPAEEAWEKGCDRKLAEQSGRRIRTSVLLRSSRGPGTRVEDKRKAFPGR
jgi:hypothetical protein